MRRLTRRQALAAVGRGARRARDGGLRLWLPGRVGVGLDARDDVGRPGR